MITNVSEILRILAQERPGIYLPLITFIILTWVWFDSVSEIWNKPLSWIKGHYEWLAKDHIPSALNRFLICHCIQHHKFVHRILWLRFLCSFMTYWMIIQLAVCIVTWTLDSLNCCLIHDLDFPDLSILDVKSVLVINQLNPVGHFMTANLVSLIKVCCLYRWRGMKGPRWANTHLRLIALYWLVCFD